MYCSSIAIGIVVKEVAGGSAPTSIVILEVVDYTFFYKKLGSAPSTNSFLISFFFLRPILALLFKSRTVLGGCNR